MKLKIDENLGREAEAVLRSHGHDVMTVPEEGLCSTSDRDLIRVCQNEKRCLVTLDLGFANPLLFKPSEFSGIAVLRLSAHPGKKEILHALSILSKGLENESIDGKLWIVQGGRIREYCEEEDN